MLNISQIIEWILLFVIGVFAKSLYARSTSQERRIDKLEGRMDVLKEKQRSDVTLLETKIDSLRELNEQKLSEILNLLELTRTETSKMYKDFSDRIGR
ncbi:MAG: hypothetical protein KAH25_01470 [Bacteroidales bacterium]|nr:hypothetical protein [Bacteroidales bacterium]